jgi:predicted nucleic acid-binding protein
LAPVVVCDSSILIATVLDEKISDNVKAILNHWTHQSFQLAAPLLFRYEIIAVTRKAVHQKRIQPERGFAIRDDLLAYPVELYFDDALLKRAYELAGQFNRPTAYDTQYLAVAERLNCAFWTADERLFNAVREGLSWVHWVGNSEIGLS